MQMHVDSPMMFVLHASTHSTNNATVEGFIRIPQLRQRQPCRQNLNDRKRCAQISNA